MKLSISHILIFLAITLLTACVPHKKIIYLQEKGDTEYKGDTIVYHQTDYRIQSGDYLYIRVISMDEKTSSFFNSMLLQNQQNTGIGESALYLTSYFVDNDGFIYFPYIGKIEVIKLTVKEAEEVVQKSLDDFLNDASVIVKLVNFNITVLGEVNTPGKINIYQDNINIFQTLGMAGDITDYGNKSKVQLIRKTKEGSIIKVLDINDKNIINSEYFWLMPDDILYVERLKGKSFVSEAFPYALIFSTITTALVIISYFN